MATTLALRSSPHRPVEIADHIFEQRHTRRLPRLQLRGRDSIAHSRFGDPDPAGCIANILKEESPSGGSDLAVWLGIVDRCKARPVTGRAKQVEHSIPRIFQQEMLLETFGLTAMGHQLQPALPGEKRT